MSYALYEHLSTAELIALLSVEERAFLRQLIAGVQHKLEPLIFASEYFDSLESPATQIRFWEFMNYYFEYLDDLHQYARNEMQSDFVRLHRRAVLSYLLLRIIVLSGFMPFINLLLEIEMVQKQERRQIPIAPAQRMHHYHSMLNNTRQFVAYIATLAAEIGLP